MKLPKREIVKSFAFLTDIFCILLKAGGLFLLFLLPALFLRCSHSKELYEEGKKYRKSLSENIAEQRKKMLEEQAAYFNKDIAFTKRDSLGFDYLTSLYEINKIEISNVLADMRQEHANQVEKLDLWITIWIAIIGALSIILPLVLGTSFRRDYEKKMEEFKRTFEEKSQGELNKFKLQATDMKKLSKEFRMNAHSLKMMEAVDCIKNVKNLDRHLYKPEQKQLLIWLFDMLADRNSEFSQIIKDLTEDATEISSEVEKERNKKIDNLLLYLLSMQSLTEEMDPLFSTSVAIEALTYISFLKCYVKEAISLLREENGSVNRENAALVVQKISEMTPLLRSVSNYLEKAYKEEMNKLV